MTAENQIVISVDGLRASALGAYGNTWYGTPAFDAVAARSTVYSRCLAEHWTPELRWPGSSSGSVASVLVTDDAGLADRPAAGQADFFRLTEPEPSSSPVESADETSTARVLASLLAGVEQTPAGEPLLARAHLRFAFGPWDAPLEPALSLLEEDDPAPVGEVTVPGLRLSECEEPDDARLLAAVRYAAQVMALDACLEATVDALDELLDDRPYQLAIIGTRGFALGEHGVVGPDARPYHECRHVPLLVRGSVSSHRRDARLLTTADISDLLTGAKAAERAHAVLQSPSGVALHDDHWKLIQPSAGPAELYSKPDDLWEVNDVAIRQPHVVEELQQTLAKASATPA